MRRNFVPAPDYARQALARVSPGDGPLLDVLSRRLAQLTGDAITAHDYELERLPTHLRLRFQVEDEAGRPLARSRDLDALRDHLRDRIAAGIAEAGRSLERTGLTAWDFGPLPPVIDVDWAGYPVAGYPALVDEGDSVGIEVFRTRTEQAWAMGAGLRRLVLLGVPSPAKAALRMLPNATKLGLGRSSYPSSGALLEDCVVAAADQLIADAGGPVWDEAAFAALLAHRPGPPGRHRRRGGHHRRRDPGRRRGCGAAPGPSHRSVTGARPPRTCAGSWPASSAPGS